VIDAPARQIAPPDFLADPGLLAVLRALPHARMVGGAVRDAIAGRPVSDVDLATPDPPDIVTRALADAGLRAAPTGLAHGTVTAISAGRGYEVTTLRHDIETDGRHARVAWTSEWREDAARRDFTFNAMSMTADGRVWDYFDGLRDLADGVVRFVGDPAQRIAEDYLRIPRFFRFHARYGTGTPDPAALAAIQAGIPGLARLSPERIWSELKRILAIPDPRQSVALMERLGVLAALVPGASAAGLHRLVAAGAPDDPLLRLAAMRPGAAQLADALRMSTAERDRLLAFEGVAPDAAMDDDALRRLLAVSPPGSLPGRAWLANGGPELQGRLSALPRPVFPLIGRDVLAQGYSPGPGVGLLLRHVEEWWLTHGCRPNRAECIGELLRIMAA